MNPSDEAVRRASYARWEARGRTHGLDREDWLAAERQERFAANYRLLAADRLEGHIRRSIGDPARRRCRYCGGAGPRASFDAPADVLPDALALGGPVAIDQCVECTTYFSEELDPALVDLGRTLRLASPRFDRGVPVDAFKALVRVALALMPAPEVEDHEDTVEWLSNPDHDFDLSLFGDIRCSVHLMSKPLSSPWVALAALSADEPWPATLLFLGLSRSIVQVPIPLGRRDDDTDQATATLPDILPPSPFEPGLDAVARLDLPIVSCRDSPALLA